MSLLFCVVVWLLKPISEILSHQWANAAGALSVGREIVVQEDMVQAIRKAPLSRALAKSREERERERRRSGWEGDKRQVAQGSDTLFQNIKSCVFNLGYVLIFLWKIWYFKWSIYHFGMKYIFKKVTTFCDLHKTIVRLCVCVAWACLQVCKGVTWQ